MEGSAVAGAGVVEDPLAVAFGQRHGLVDQRVGGAGGRVAHSGEVGRGLGGGQFMGADRQSWRRGEDGRGVDCGDGRCRWCRRGRWCGDDLLNSDGHQRQQDDENRRGERSGSPREGVDSPQRIEGIEAILLRQGRLRPPRGNYGPE